MSIPDRRRRYGIFAAGVLTAIVLLVVFFDWNLLRGPLAGYLSVRFDRPVAIHGDIAVDLGRRTRVQIDGLSIANVSWSSRQPMVTAKSVVVWFTIASLLRLQPIRAQLTDTDVVLERHSRRAAP